MGFKCIAIGNRLMTDDAIGIYVAEAIEELLNKEGIEVVLGETDVYYTLSKVSDGDFLFILDSTQLDAPAGTITTFPLDKLPISNKNSYSLHHPSLLTLIASYHKLVKGLLIGIEVDKIDFSLGLSHSLESLLPSLCQEVYRLIMENRRNNNA